MFEKLTWTCGLFVIFSSCFTKTERVSNREISADQRKIQMLVDSFKRLAYQASTLTTKDSIRLSYATKFYDLLSNISIDSIRVHVDSVKIVDSTISTQFHCGKEIVFKSSLTFPAQMTPKYDSLFKFMKGLRPGLDTLVSFGYMGNHQVRLPSSDDPILKIFAYPVPIWIGNN